MQRHAREKRGVKKDDSRKNEIVSERAKTMSGLFEAEVG
jgi:hypothetical protein